MQANLNLDDYIRRATDRFSYLRLDAPEFPSEDTDAPTEFAKQKEHIQQILRRTRSPDKRKWLEISLRELDESLAAYEAGDADEGLDVLYRAEEHFKNAIRGTPHTPTFISDERGQSRLVVSGPTQNVSADMEERDIAGFEADESASEE